MGLLRSSLWEVIFYPDSMPDYWKDVIEDTKVPCALSPLHTLDRWTAKDEATNAEHVQGTLKKPHYHLFVDYGAGANKSADQVKADFCVPLNGKAVPEVVKSNRGMCRYLIHMDHPEKAQYRMDEIRFFNGFDPKDFFDLSTTEVNNLCPQIESLIESEHLYSYRSLCLFLQGYDMHMYFYVTSHTYHFSTYLKCFKEGVKNGR